MKRIALSGLLLLASVTTFAQFTLGLKTGVNLATLKGDVGDESNRLGYQAGAWARFGGAGFYLQPEVYLGSKGGEFGSINQDGTTYHGEGKVNFTTLDIPVLLGNKFGFDKLNFRIMAGPVISFVLDKSAKENFEVATDFNNYKDQTIGLQTGAGVDLGNISVDLRYEKGLSNINKSGQYDQKQNLWHLSLGYKLF
ncbi:porin family protein [Paradesertivirga mongoliensis]|uniref:Porin family protein n=1 Tax=Paradesertivirga mongoliensis TaxID=2100740 RepID=A0ABW4ZIK2_9SPHI|nr:porin family protein [Pedobacter mongoliensis]